MQIASNDTPILILPKEKNWKFILEAKKSIATTYKSYFHHSNMSGVIYAFYLYIFLPSMKLCKQRQQDKVHSKIFDHFGLVVDKTLDLWSKIKLKS